MSRIGGTDIGRMSLVGGKLHKALSLVKFDSIFLDMAVESRERGIDIGSAKSKFGNFSEASNWEMLIERRVLGAIAKTNQIRFWDSIIGSTKTLSRSRTLVVQAFMKARQYFFQVESRRKVLNAI